MITQPSSDITLPEDVQRAVEQSRNLVSIHEAEALRLRELATSSQYTVNELHKAKVDLEATIASLEAKQKQYSENIAESKALLASTQEELSKVNAEVAQKTEEMNQKQSELSKTADELSERDRLLFVRESELIKKESAVSEMRVLLEKKIESIKDFANTL